MAKSRKKNQGGTASPSTAPPAASPQGLGEGIPTEPNKDRIAARAYELYVARGGGDGLALDDWLTAERELSSGHRRDRES